MSDLQDLTNELMQDDDFRKEYESLKPEMDIKRAILDDCVDKNNSHTDQI